MFDTLFSPITIGTMELKNRVIFPAMGTKFSGKTREVTQKLVDYHVARAEGGCGLNLVEVASVHKLSSPRGFLAISEDKYVPGFKKLTDAIHEAGGKAGIQLWQGSLAVGMDQAAMVLLASDMPVSPEMTLPGMTIEQIKEIVDCYGEAARRAVQAGFDCVEFHCAHNYLPHSFLSAGLNHRTDEYGGSFENRSKMPLECIRAIRANLPAGMPLLMRIDAHDDYLEKGLTIEDVIEFCKRAKEAGVDVLDISRGNIVTAAIKYEVPPIDIAKGFNVNNAAIIRKETGMTTIAVGRINDPKQAEDILCGNQADLVMIGRAQLADAQFCIKAMNGEIEDIDYCVGCNQGCFDGFENKDSQCITCLRNPALGKEKEWEITPADKPETVLIAGGGIGGLEAAIQLRKRGHNPILCEASDLLGGQFLTAGAAPRKAEMKETVIAMGEKAKRLGVDIRMNTTVTPDLIKEINPHTFINAIGAIPLIPPIKGSHLPFVLDSHDVLSGKVKAKGHVVVIGGGMVGMETAELLAEMGCKVTVLEMTKEFCADMGRIRKICVTENIYAAGIIPVTEVTVTEIKEGIVFGKKDGKNEEYPCDYAVMAVGAISRDGKALEQACYDNKIACFVIGDGARARRAIDATREAFQVAMTFDKPEVHNDALKAKKVVFITGATGTMGQETMKQLLNRSGRFKVRILARQSKKNQELLKKYACPALEVVWGDMTDYDTILKCVSGASYVLHIGAMVSPAADKYPEQTLYTNIGSTLNIIKAIKEQPDPDAVKFVYIGTVAMTGCRMPPVHWGRVGDPMNPSIHDYYAMSKVFSEMALFNSGLKYWVSIRQTGQHPNAEGAGEEPIFLHQNANNVLEWSTAIESGICMANICESWVNESFWRKAYNLSSGETWRMTAWQFSDLNIKPMGLTSKDITDPRMLARFNFHGHFYTDSKKLEDYLHFRFIDFDEYWQGVHSETEEIMANPMIREMMPTAEQIKANQLEIAKKPMGFTWMFENNEEDWIHAFFGSREEQAKIKSMEEGYEFCFPSMEETYLNHGYDESKELENMSLEDLNNAARFRGGSYEGGKVENIHMPVQWKCADGHEFMQSINGVLHGGHWCPECMKEEWHYAEIARKNPFYAQVWIPTHGDGDDYRIKMKYSAYHVYNELKGRLGL